MQIEQEHLLYALLDQPDSFITQLMVSLNVKPNELISAVMRKIETLPKVSGSGREPDKVYVSKEADQTLNEAEKQAKAMKDEYVSVEHIFLALLDTANSRMKELFKSMSIDKNAF